MTVLDRLRRLAKDLAGATLVEMALVLPMLLVLTFGLVEFGVALWQYNSAEKATADAARYVATHGPLVAGLNDCIVATDAAAGTSCSEVGANGAPAGSWTGDSCAAPCQAAVMAEVVQRVQALAPFVEPQNVEVELRGSNFGYVGRGAPVPMITVRLVDLQYDFVAIDDLLGFGAVDMPGFDATSVGEDQQGVG